MRGLYPCIIQCPFAVAFMPRLCLLSATFRDVTGDVRIDGYEILRELGRGAMGVVYLARDTLLEREVAIKLIGDSREDARAIEIGRASCRERV